MSGCGWELNTHFYSAASLCFIKSQSLYLIAPQPHYTDTGATRPSPTPKIRVPSGEQLVPFVTTLVCRGPGSNDIGADTLPTAIPSSVVTKRGSSEKCIILDLSFQP